MTSLTCAECGHSLKDHVEVWAPKVDHCKACAAEDNLFDAYHVVTAQ